MRDDTPYFLASIDKLYNATIVLRLHERGQLMLAAMIVAVRQALDYTSTRRAIAVCGFGWALSTALAVLFGVLFGPRVS